MSAHFRLSLIFWIGMCLASREAHACFPLEFVAVARVSWQAAESRPRFKVSRETTFLTAPLRPDGHVDYAAAINAYYGARVTPENNAAVDFLRAVGPKSVPRGTRSSFFHKLGMKELPEQGPYWRPLFDFRNVVPAPPGLSRDAQIDARIAEEDRAADRPWRAEECPRIAAWLTANGELLDQIVVASQKPRWFSPAVVDDNGTLFGAVVGTFVQELREVSRALIARSMLRAQSGRLEDAWQDLLAVHRLARLSGQGPTVVDGLVGIAIEGMACRADQRFAANVALPADRLRAMSADLAGLPPLSDLRTNVVDRGERFMHLDFVQWLSKAGPVGLDQLWLERPALWKLALNGPLTLATDWNVPLAAGNDWYDRVVAAAGLDDREARRTTLLALEAECDREKPVRTDTPPLRVWLHPPRALGDWIAQELTGQVLLSYRSSFEAEDRARTDLLLTRTYFALLAFEAEHGHYPQTLGDLVPKYLDASPRDFSLRKEFVYKRDGGSFLLYSLGPNGIDDGGTFRERETDDDASVKAPAPKAES